MKRLFILLSILTIWLLWWCNYQSNNVGNVIYWWWHWNNKVSWWIKPVYHWNTLWWYNKLVNNFIKQIWINNKLKLSFNKLNTNKYWEVVIKQTWKNVNIVVYWRSDIEKIHEIGHIIMYLLINRDNYWSFYQSHTPCWVAMSIKSPFYEYCEFYKKEWFVSKYAKTNIYESFAEDFTFYYLFNNYFMNRKDLKYRQRWFKKYFWNIKTYKNFHNLIKDNSKIYQASNYLYQ